MSFLLDITDELRVGRKVSGKILGKSLTLFSPSFPSKPVFSLGYRIDYLS